MKKIVSFLLIFAFGLSGCEKDDICDPDTPTTPRVVITFYDINNSTLRKNVSNLMIIGKGSSDTLIINKTAIGITKFLANGDSIAVPLKTTVDTTAYKFILNAGSTNPPANTDELTFVYSRKNAYVSRACGFKTTFQLENPIPTIPDLNGVWMQNIFLINPNIEYENETHIKVFF